MAGRPRKTNEAKKAEGTLRKDRIISNCIKYEPVRTLPNIDADLNDDGKKWFNQYVQYMIDQGLMTTAFIDDFEKMAFVHQSAKYYQRNLQEDGYFTICPTGYKQANPSWKGLMEALRTLKDFYQRYGIDLASSQKISVPDVTADEFDQNN